MRKLSLFLIFFILITNSFLAQDTIKRDTIIIDSLKIQIDTLSIKKDSIALNWIPTISEALEKSKKENKPVLIYFTGSDWCTPCIVLDKELFHTQKFKDIADENLILYMADSPKNSDHMSQDIIDDNNLLQYKYSVNAFPTLLFVNHKGKKVALKRGYNISEYYYPFINSVIKKY